ELRRVQAERLEDGRANLHVRHVVGDGRGLELRARQDQRRVRVVGREATVLGNLLLAFAVDHTGDWLDDQVRRARVGLRIAETLGQGLTVDDAGDVGGVAGPDTLLQRLDGLLAVVRVRQPDERDVVLGGLCDGDLRVPQHVGDVLDVVGRARIR